MTTFFNTIMLLTLLLSTEINAWWFTITPVSDLVAQNSSIQYRTVFHEIPFHFIPSQFAMGDEYHPSQGYFNKTFVLEIPNGTVYSHYGWVIVNNCFIKELIWKDIFVHLNMIEQLNPHTAHKIHGRVAVITQLAFFNYFHWLSEVLGRLALLELKGIAYDAVYAPQSLPFMQETLELWGIPKEKIIQPYDDTYYIQADELIVPSLVSNINFGLVYFSCYPQPHLITYVKEKLAHAADQRTTHKKFSKRIFISRKDAPQRFVTNEDEVFAILHSHGFERYELTKLSALEQIKLFQQAEIVVSPQGTGLTNIIFCKKGTTVIELLQALNDTTIFYLTQIFQLNYVGVQTTPFTTDYVQALTTDTHIPLNIVQKVVQENIMFLNT